MEEVLSYDRYERSSSVAVRQQLRKKFLRGSYTEESTTTEELLP